MNELREEITALNRALRLLKYSLPVYLRQIQPWRRRNSEKAAELLAQWAADHEEWARQISAALVDLRGEIEPGGFPTRFAALHDLSMGYLVQVVYETQVSDTKALAQCVRQLAKVPWLGSLLEQILRKQHDYLDKLRSLLEQKQSASTAA